MNASLTYTPLSRKVLKEEEDMSSGSILKIRKLNKAYGQNEVLKDINFSIEYGKIVGLLGKNGAGKTTLIKIIIGLLNNYQGEIYYQGELIDHSDVLKMNTIGSLVDTSFHNDLSAYDNMKILMMATPNKEKQSMRNDIMQLLTFVGLEPNYKDKVKSFSFGMKQRLALAQALIVEPKLLILDEPFVGLDPPGIELVKERLKELCVNKQVSIIFSSHQLAEVAELSEDLVVIDQGCIQYFGSYEALASANKKYSVTLDRTLSKEDIAQITKGLGYDIVCDAQTREVHFHYSEGALNQILRTLIEMDYTINEINKLDNALAQLFK